MLIETTSFKTRARTIDHLGREQIADCPTAISELWKNSYDAYARSVELNIFDGKLPVAALVDDGHGMDKAELIEKWLVVGTESKATGGVTPDHDRSGLPIRPRQGQKGIGRLSCATMGSLLLLITKRKNQPYAATLIDWRIFENPFLLLNDVQVPVVEFINKEDLAEHLPIMFDALMSNLWGSGKELDVERDARIRNAWLAYDEFELREKGRAKTRAEIEERIIESCFDSRHFNCWPVWNGTSNQGTALFVTGISYDLTAHLSRESLSNAESIEATARRKFHETLSGFIDPYYRDDENTPGSDFSCGVIAWNGDLQRIVLDKVSSFSIHELDKMEHFVEGKIDEEGVFKGHIRVLGRDFYDITIPPEEPIKNTETTRVGSFSIRLSTYEQLLKSTTHTAEQHADLEEKKEKYAGFMIHRDSFRLMPYGREDSDYFKIGLSYSKNAGDAFWAPRRIFGGVKITRAANPNLRDKAGREGFIDNRAAKQFRDIVVNLLKTLGKKYFGRHSENRKEFLPQVQASNEQKNAELNKKKLITRQRRETKAKLKLNADSINQMLESVNQLELDLVAGEQLSTLEDALALQRRLSKLAADSKELGLGPRPVSLGSLESEYTDYRRKEKSIAAAISNATASISIALERLDPSAPQEIVSKEIFGKAASLSNRIRKWGVAAENELREEQARLKELISSRHKLFHSANSNLVSEVETKNIDLVTALKTLEDSYQNLSQENEAIFPPYIEALKSLREQIDLEGLVSHSVKETADLRDEIARIHALAQLGITVEIIGHEIEDLDLSIERGLNAMEPSTKNTVAYQQVQTAHHALSDRWRFLSPLKLSGEKVRKIISGEEISSYVEEFFHDFLLRSEIHLEITDAFKQIKFSELPSRIYPVFVNLLNNARYWVRHSTENKKTISFDFRDGKVIVADNGPGVSEEDILSLFTLFFTKKASGGRGVGLYLCRTNLAAGGHKIWYETDEKNRVLSGANFVIEFSGVNNVS